MKVLFLTNIPSPYRVEFFDLLSQQCELTVIYERRSASDREDEWYIKSKIKYEVHFLNGINYSNDASLAPSVVNFLVKRKYDIFVVSGYSSATQMLALITLKMRHVPYFLNVDGGMIKDESRFKYCYKKMLISGAAAYLSTGKACDDFLMYYGAEPDRLKRYPFTSVREKDILSRPLSIEEKRFYKEKIGCSYSKMILSVGQPIYRKGFDILIKAVSKLSVHDVCVFIVGGEPNNECIKLIKELKLSNVVFIPFTKREELSKYYKAADLFVFPTREDIWGLVINEAMAYGMPIITTNKCNAGLELVKDNGYIIDSDKVDELANAINDSIKSDNMYFSQKSLEIIADYTIEKMVDAHKTHFKNYLNLKR